MDAPFAAAGMRIERLVEIGESVQLAVAARDCLMEVDRFGKRPQAVRRSARWHAQGGAELHAADADAGVLESRERGDGVFVLDCEMATVETDLNVVARNVGALEERDGFF